MSSSCRSRWLRMPARGCGGAPGLEGQRQGRSKDPSRRRVQVSPAGRGDHEVWISPHACEPFTVPVTIASRHTANKAFKDAGLPQAF
jgi:hypothetical protein